MTQQKQHPITPPPHLIEQWMQDHTTKYDLARQAAQWGYDQCLKEFEAAMSDVVPPPEDFKSESELVSQIAIAIGGNDYELNAEAWEDTARVAIRQVANWLKGHTEVITSNHLIADLLLEADK